MFHLAGESLKLYAGIDLLHVPSAQANFPQRVNDWAAGRVALRESVSKATVENAAEWLVQQGGEGGEDTERPALTLGWREQQLPDILRELARHLAS